MDPSFDLDTFSLPSWLCLSGSFLIALIITWGSIPTIVKISKFKKLHAHIDERTSHHDDTPNLGGVAIFAATALSILIFSLNHDSGTIVGMLGGMIVLFLIGIKDDILIIDPNKKFAGQFLASVIVVCLGEIRITNFHLALGIGDISPMFSIIFTVFIFLLLINGFNLIDGIDGLASGLGIITSLVYGIWFILSGHITYGVISLSLAGALISFFRFNVFSKNNKIFLGDTGSMLIGFVLAVLTVKFIEFNLKGDTRYSIESAPAVAYSLLIIPLIDVLRVVVIRFWNGKSPFKADRNHFHHTLLQLGYSHLGITITLVVLSLIFLTAGWLLRNLGVVKNMVLLTILAIIVSSAPWLVLKLRPRQGNNQ